MGCGNKLRDIVLVRNVVASRRRNSHELPRNSSPDSPSIMEGHMRQVLPIVSFTLPATLAGCSSSSNETGSPPVETTTTDPRVASTVTGPITSSSRRASLAGVASINFGAYASLDGTSVTIAQVRYANLDKVALSEA